MLNEQYYQPLLTLNPYFNRSGLTSSEANYICERIKEHLKPIQDEVQDIQTHTSSLDGEFLDDFQKVDNIAIKLTEIGELYAISAYLRTAIKEKESRLNRITIKLNEVRVKIMEKIDDIDHAELNRLYINVNIDDYLLTRPLSEVVEYKTAEAKAAHIGKFVHNFDEIRKKMMKKERISFKEVGGQVFKIHHQPLYTLEELQAVQAFLLAEHREYESIVNQYKAKLHEFQNQMQLKYEEEVARLTAERENQINQQVAEASKALLEIKSKIAELKIVVPHEFKNRIDLLLNRQAENTLG